MTSSSLRTIMDLRPGDHLCCIYETEDEHQATVTSFLRRGLEQGEKVIYIVDTHTAETILGYLRDDGMDVQPYLDRGQLVTLTYDQTYMQEGVFDPERMIGMLRSETERALTEGYPALRVTGEMAWVLRGLPGSERLIEYEARLNEFFPGSQCLAICQYDRRRFAPEMLLDALRTHPIAMVGREVYDNFYYIPPADLLTDAASAAELRCWLHNLTRRRQTQESHQRLSVQVARDRQLTEELAIILERERHTLHTIMENTHAHLVYLDPQFNFVRVNSAYAQGAGYSKEELIGRNHFELFPHAENQAIFERVRETGEPAVFHGKPFVYPDRPELGTTYWDWTLVPVRDWKGEVQGLVLSLLDVTERERAREQIRQQNEFLNTVLESLTHAFYVLDTRDYTVKIANSAARRNSPSAGTTCYAMTHSSDRPCETTEHPCPVEEVKRTKQPVVVEHLHYDKDGSPAHVELHCYPIFDGEGNVSQVIEYTLDITKRRRAEETLRQHAERLSHLSEIDRAILAAQSLEEIAEQALRHVQYLMPCQHASVAVFDFEANEISLLAADTHEKVRLGTGERAALEQAWPLEELREGRVYAVNDTLTLSPPSPWIQILGAKGVRSWTSVPLIAGGELIGSLNLGMDHPGRLSPEQVHVAWEVANQLAIGAHQAHLHEKEQRYADELETRVAERTAALRASEARFRALFEEAALGIALVDTEGRLRDSNPALQKVLGYGDEELRGMGFMEFTYPDDAAAILDLHQELLAGKRDQYKVESRLVRKDGQLVQVNLVVSLIRGTGSEPELAIGLIEDITEQKQAQAALIQAEKLSIAGRLAASLAHEISNPLQSVIGCLGLAEETLSDGGDVSRYLQVARDELRRAARIVAQLRDMQRPSSLEERVPTDVNALLDHVLTLSRNQCQDHGVEVVCRRSDDLPSLSLVPDRIQQVFLNLILNAIDANPEGGLLEISTTRTNQPDGVRVAFSDSGVGIAPGVLPLIFDPFFSTRHEGLGLGLFISHNIVKQHGGHIEVDSQVGEGTTFTVWLPA